MRSLHFCQLLLVPVIGPGRSVINTKHILQLILSGIQPILKQLQFAYQPLRVVPGQRSCLVNILQLILMALKCIIDLFLLLLQDKKLLHILCVLPGWSRRTRLCRKCANHCPQFLHRICGQPIRGSPLLI